MSMIKRKFYCKGKVSISDFYCKDNISDEFWIMEKRNEKMSMIERDFYCKGKVSISDFYCKKNISHEFLIMKNIYDRKRNNVLKWIFNDMTW